MKQYFDSDEYHEDYINGKIEQDRQMQQEQDKQINDQINKQMYEDMMETPVYSCKWKSANDFLTECGYDKEDHVLHSAKGVIATMIDVYMAAKLLDLQGKLPSNEEIEKIGAEGGLRDDELQMFWEGAVRMRDVIFKKLIQK